MTKQIKKRQKKMMTLKVHHAYTKVMLIKYNLKTKNRQKKYLIIQNGKEHDNWNSLLLNWLNLNTFQFQRFVDGSLPRFGSVLLVRYNHSLVSRPFPSCFAAWREFTIFVSLHKNVNKICSLHKNVNTICNNDLTHIIKGLDI